ncbi:MAG: aminotransferase class V-fold PLP-dependent enzyme [Saprospirales bacterium]|nr:MAG: aminotransferase class V-fold PLP-dependent enzyme [Saprospirales bacterium]
MAINLISDTVTKPGLLMLEAMMEAKVGDDVFGQDPTVNKLESLVAEIFGMEASLFCPSGTMTNQIAINLSTQPMDEIICEVNSHIHHYENASYARISGVGLNLVEGENGLLSPQLIKQAIRPETDWYPRSSLVVIENTCNKAGGTHYTMNEMAAISEFCRRKGLRLHLDGARIFNAVVIEGMNTKEIGPLFDTISICLSKGLGAPVGSLLLGSKKDIKQARRIRKALGGGMRQAGFLAAAGIYALQNQIEDLKLDHQKADLLKEALKNRDWVASIREGRTNIVIFDLKNGVSADDFLQKMKESDILCSAFGPSTVRMVTHRDINKEEIMKCVEVINQLNTADLLS